MFHAHLSQLGHRTGSSTRCGAFTKASSRRFPTVFVILGYAPAKAGSGVAESFFQGTHSERGRVEAIGTEVMEIVDGKIKR